jgi:D-sedoheptulose 7-phosphate isomerase
MISEYVENLKWSINNIPMEKIEEMIFLLKKVRDSGNTIFIIGNGGSASTAEHFATDLQNKGIKAISLSSNSSLITALGNDIGYENIFSYQLETMMMIGDILVTISGSGNSKNIINAIETAKSKILTIGLSGSYDSKSYILSDLAIVTRGKNIQIIEDVHLIIAHMVGKEL